MMNILQSLRPALPTVILVLLGSADPATAEVYTFRVAFESVPGVEHIVDGNPAKAIEVLEEARVSGEWDEGPVLATLCGAYVLKQELANAERVCADAVTRFPSDTGYNNRGVLRALHRDFDGARRDFDRARPRSMDEYMAILRTRDIGLVTSSNYRLLENLSADHASEEVQSYTSIPGAQPEPLDD